jgi:putative acetyltransferase
VVVRDEAPADIAVIDEITRAAFAGKTFSDQTEHFVIRDLRAAGALTLSLVAEVEGEVVGHVAFSPVEISDGSRDWYGLGPIAVRPGLQGRGIGSALILAGLERLNELGARGCILLGDPGYYGRFGFANRPELVYEGVPPEYFMALGFGGDQPHGTVMYHPAFLARE